MAALFARDANITDDAANSSTGCQDSCTLAPNFIEFVEKGVVILYLSKLAPLLFVFFQCPIRR